MVQMTVSRNALHSSRTNNALCTYTWSMCIYTDILHIFITQFINKYHLAKVNNNYLWQTTLKITFIIQLAMAID